MPLCVGAGLSDEMVNDGMDEGVLVQWQLPMQLGAGQILLLSIVQEQLATLHQVISGCMPVGHPLILLLRHFQAVIWLLLVKVS